MPVVYRVPAIKYIGVGEGYSGTRVPRITSRSVARQKYDLWRSLCNDRKLSCYLGTLRTSPALILSCFGFFPPLCLPARDTLRLPYASTWQISLFPSLNSARLIVALFRASFNGGEGYCARKKLQPEEGFNFVRQLLYPSLFNPLLSLDFQTH